MTTLDPMKAIPDAMKQIGGGGGAFLTVKAGDALNTMTIGWAMGGIVWGLPIMTVLVRPSRFTFGIIEKAADFTVSVPESGYKEELAFCGTRSGREGDKFKGCGLAIVNSQKTISPIIKLAGIHFECRIVHAAPMSPARADAAIKKFYSSGDFHTMYSGVIETCYTTGS